MAKRGRPMKTEEKKSDDVVFFFVSDDGDIETAITDGNIDFVEERIEAEGNICAEDFDSDDEVKYIHEVKFVKTYKYVRIPEYTVGEIE